MNLDTPVWLIFRERGLRFRLLFSDRPAAARFINRKLIPEFEMEAAR